MEHLPALLLLTVIILTWHSVVWALAIPRQHLRQEAPYLAATIFGVFIFEALVIVAPLMMSQSNQGPLEGAHVGYMAYISVALPFRGFAHYGRGSDRLRRRRIQAARRLFLPGGLRGFVAGFCGVVLMVQLLAHVF